MPSALFNASGSWPVPANLAAPPRVQVWGPGGNGAAGTGGVSSGAGGASAAYAEEPSLLGLIAGTSTLTITMGLPGSGTGTTVTGGTVTVAANAGGNGSGTTAGTAGAAGSNTVARAGSAGGAGFSGSSKGGGGGAGSPGATGSGGAGSAAPGGTSGAAGGAAGASGGAAGGAGGASGAAGSAGGVPGAGGGGGGSSGSQAAGTAGTGQVIITWTVITYSAFGYSAAASVMTGAKKVAGGFKGLMSAIGAPLPAGVVNQWTGTFAQPAAFGNAPPALQSVVVPLTPASSVGGGGGTPSPGNWLVVIAAVNEQSATAGYTVNVRDDIGSYWRPAVVSQQAALTRVSVWYTANTARQAGRIYVAPNGALDALSVLVTEVAGLSPWDVVTGLTSGYSAGATTLGVSLAAPAAASFTIAAACGDLAGAGQATAPAGWTTLSTVTAANGTDHTSDAVLTAAYINTSGGVTATTTTGSASDLSTVILGVQRFAASPIPPGSNPAWPHLIAEAAFGSGYQTPDDQMTWTDITKRFWSWHETAGVQYQLGALQASDVDMEIDNQDGAFSPGNTASPYWPLVTDGTPVRLRMALGTIGGTQVNRWYEIRKNASTWPEKRNKALRGFVPAKLTDVWSVASASLPTPYRGEVTQDTPGWWWPCDDQPGLGGVLPSSLRNAATGSTRALSIVQSPNGGTAQDPWVTPGARTTENPGLGGAATYQVAAEGGWMPGDPQSSPGSAASGNPVTAQPGSAAWQQVSEGGLVPGFGNTGSYGWFLSCNDTFPPLAGGVTVETWFKYPFFGLPQAGTTTGVTGVTSRCAVPYCPLTIMTLTSATAVTAILQLDVAGHLSLKTYSGGSATTHSVYSTSDLRTNTWHHVAVELTATTWRVLVDGGLTADASGTTAAMASAWSWLVLNGDMGTSAGSAVANIAHSSEIWLSHIAVYTGLLPAWRVRARYTAAIMAFGALPPPAQIEAQMIGDGLTGDGSMDTALGTGLYGGPAAGSFNPATISARVVAVAGPYTSAASAWSPSTNNGRGMIAWVGFSGLAPKFRIYTGSQVGSETQASVTGGAGDGYLTGYGSGASATGFCHLAGGDGSSPPAAATGSPGDTVGQRIERLLGAGGLTAARCIDQAPLLVQAGADTGGSQAGQAITNVVLSDDGLFYVLNSGALAYRERPHLAADTPVWALGPDVDAGQYPYSVDQAFDTDMTRVWNAIEIQPYAPDGSSPPSLTPTDAAAANASQRQHGARPLSQASYLQDQSKAQNQADWLLATYGQPARRVTALKVDAASHPAAFPFVAGCCVGDQITVADSPIGAPPTTGTYVISQVTRIISFGANGSSPEASVEITADPVVTPWV